MKSLEILGVPAVQAANAERSGGPESNGGGPVCFDTPSRYEITWQGKKLIGSAQLRRKKIVLQHGSLPLHGDLNRIIDALAFSEAERTRQKALLPRRATTLAQALGQVLSFETVAGAIAQGFAQQLNLTLQELPLTAEEQALADRLRAEQYANEGWLKRV
jgi:lipoate-protein ligase A